MNKTIGIAGAGGASLAALAVAAGVLFGPHAASAQTANQTWNVQVGGASADMSRQFIGYGPDPVTISVGDTVKWAGQAGNPEPHTVTFNSGKPDLPFIVPTGTGDLMVGPGGFPVGVTGSAPISYDGTQQISSGAPLGPGQTLSFAVTFTKAGIFNYVCELHPGMRGQVIVLPTGTPLPESPAQATARGTVTMNYLLYRQQQDDAMIKSSAAGDVHTVSIGNSDSFGTASQMYLPGNVTVKRGEVVTFTNVDVFEPHTVTFVGQGATPPDFIVPKPQPSGPPQLTIPGTTVAPSGGSSFTGQGVNSSGLLGGQGGAGASYALKIDAPAGTYTYFCLIHGSPEGGMRGTITVTE